MIGACAESRGGAGEVIAKLGELLKDAQVAHHVVAAHGAGGVLFNPGREAVLVEKVPTGQFLDQISPGVVAQTDTTGL